MIEHRKITLNYEIDARCDPQIIAALSGGWHIEMVKHELGARTFSFYREHRKNWVVRLFHRLISLANTQTPH